MIIIIMALHSTWTDPTFFRDHHHHQPLPADFAFPPLPAWKVRPPELQLLWLLSWWAMD